MSERVQSQKKKAQPWLTSPCTHITAIDRSYDRNHTEYLSFGHSWGSMDNKLHFERASFWYNCWGVKPSEIVRICKIFSKSRSSRMQDFLMFFSCSIFYENHVL
ncbi:hypothetical protein CFP56_042971 [Quercus suber]|uniref:Uncharacterized protein n=1 Tax=Quercus suber TaxID=58331 RepID=A0AAW0ISY0_QUESU